MAEQTQSDEPVLMDLQTKAVNIRPEDLYSAINPRDLDDLEGIELMPSIEETKGVITTPLVIWNPGEDHPIWKVARDTLTNELVEVDAAGRKRGRIIVQGHRREFCASTAQANPDRYSAEMIKNLSKLPAIELTCSQEEAESVAMDFEKSKRLKSWNVVKLVFQLFDKMLTSSEVSKKIPSLCFEALLEGDGEAMYEAILRENPNGAERTRKIVKKLRNKVDSYLYSAHLLGPAVKEQVLFFFKFEKNKLADKRGEKDRLITKADYNFALDMKKEYTKATENGQPWTPITRIEVVDGKPEGGDDVSFRPGPGDTNAQGRYLVVEGGTAEARDKLLGYVYRFFSGVEDDKGPKPLTSTQRKETLSRTHSGAGRSMALRFDSNHKEPVEGKILKDQPRDQPQWEEWCLFCEAVQQRLLELQPDSQPMIQELIVALTSQASPKPAAARVTKAVDTLNAALQPSKTTK